VKNGVVTLTDNVPTYSDMWACGKYRQAGYRCDGIANEIEVNWRVHGPTRTSRIRQNGTPLDSRVQQKISRSSCARQGYSGRQGPLLTIKSQPLKVTFGTGRRQRSHNGIVVEPTVSPTEIKED